jgi:hypothetical protein
MIEIAQDYAGSHLTLADSNVNEFYNPGACQQVYLLQGGGRFS